MNILSNGGVVVVIGARRSNVGDALWEHPQITYWESEQSSRKGLPTNTKAVIFTRFIGHATFASVVTEAKKRGITVFPLTTTGELKKTLGAIVDGASRGRRPTDEDPVLRPQRLAAASLPKEIQMEAAVVEQKDKRPYGWLAARIKECLTAGRSAEATVAWFAAEHGHTISRDRVVSELARCRKIGKRRRATSTPPVAAIPPLPPSRTRSSASPDDLVRLVDDAIAALQLVKEAAEKHATDRERLRDHLDRLRAGI